MESLTCTVPFKQALTPVNLCHVQSLTPQVKYVWLVWATQAFFMACHNSLALTQQEVVYFLSSAGRVMTPRCVKKVTTLRRDFG